MPPLPSSFVIKKQKILSSLSTPSAAYTDLSPKGSVDTAILPLIHEINALEGLVTTSSCAGRISVFLEGRKLDAAVGGKGGGGRWLFVSHEPLNLNLHEDLEKLFGLQVGVLDRRPTGMAVGRTVRFQFEPMVCMHYVIFAF
jgi:tRNA wybutosine-synthesizing protein 3